MNVIVTGGGSGGHIYPALSIADEFKRRDDNTNVLYIGSDIGIESRIVPEYGYDFEIVDSRYFDVINPIEAFKTTVRVVRGIFSSLKIMKKYKPDIVIGTGGYVCVPVIVAGKLFGAKTFIHEQNVIIGLSNKLLQHFVNKIFVAFETGKESFKKRNKVVYTGNPIRKSFFEKTEGCDSAISDKKDIFTVFLLAGSQGADTINELGVMLMEKLVNDDFAIKLCTGPRRYENIINELHEKKIPHDCEGSDNEVFSYAENMQDYISSSDIIVGRAGSLSISEILALGKPSILIPSPNVVGNHQYYNAKAVADKGAAILIKENDLKYEEIIGKIKSLRDDEQTLREMSVNAKEISITDAAANICDNILG